MKRFFLGLLLALLVPLALGAEPVWVDKDAGGNKRVHLYFFWSKSCPHCQRARPFVENLPASNPWLVLHSYQVQGDKENTARYVAMARGLGEEATSVPAFLFCGHMETGYYEDATTGARLLAELEQCRSGWTPSEVRRETVNLPLLGEVDAGDVSLPFFTLVIAGLDAFNPCAFFVLLFLLSLLAREKSRARMLVIGGVFVFFSGLIYFVFMAAWLNAFLLMGEIRAVTVAAGGIAVVMATLNIKDFFRFREGPTLSIPESAKPNLYRRVRSLLEAGSWPVMLGGTVMLAIAANTYELLCTAGFPMVYTRALTLHHLSTAAYYGYLVLYNLVYVLPLALIVAAFAFTLRGHKLTEGEGRALKLLSGVMMLGLGMLLLAAPDWLSSPAVAAALVGFAVAVTAILVWRQRQSNAAR